MSEKEIVNFDRKVEQMMNEHSVAPPFGMWNRIAAELEPVATVAPAKPLLPKSAVIGFIAGALVIGSTLAGVVMYNNSVENQQTAITGNTKEVTAPVNTAITAPAVENTPAKAENLSQQVTVAVVATHKSEVKKAVARAESQSEVARATPHTLLIAENTQDVAAPEVAVGENSAVEDAYYFPPVDIKTTNEKSFVSENKGISKTVVADKSDDDEKETRKAKISTASGERVKFRPKKPKKFSYGRINRYKR